MNRLVHAAMISCLLSACWSAFAESAPSSAPVMGWRGGGNGKFPNANPPLEFGRVSKSIKELTVQTRKPAGDAPPEKDSAITDGVIRKWLVLGPLPLPESQNGEEALKDAETLSPDENEKVADKSWRTVTSDTCLLDFCSVFNVPPEITGVVAFAYTNIYSPSGDPVLYSTMNSGQGSNYIWLNGKKIYFSGKNVDCSSAPVTLSLQKGWNRLMVMVSRAKNIRKTWWFMGTLYPGKASEIDSHGVLWSTFTPTPGASSPVIAGDRIFFTGESGTVFCADKSGKLLWSRSVNYCEFTTDEERKAHPEEFKTLDTLYAQLKTFDQLDVEVPWKSPVYEKDFRNSLEAAIFNLLLKVNRKKYWSDGQGRSGSEAGWSPFNPITDGTFVYALFGSGLVACYDLDGNRKWQHLLNLKPIEHSYSSSPLLVDGKQVIYLDNFTELDAKTGEILVDRPHFRTDHGFHGQFFGTGCVLPAGNEKVLYYPNDEFVRLSDGKTLTITGKAREILKSAGNMCQSPVVEDGVAYTFIEHGSDGSGHVYKADAIGFKLPPLSGDTVAPEITSDVPFNLDKFPYWYNPGHSASPLFVDGLLYLVDTIGTLTVIDMVKGDVVYQRRLDLDNYLPVVPYILRGGVCACPTLAGKYIYLWGNHGTCIAMEPGRAYKQVARLRLESPIRNPYFCARQEATITSPVFDGERMYLRGEYTLYCIGAK